ncbi:extended synaptotagmin-2-like [Scylla paramamosain]|uniref:extended synaptotagmin-2-like n=1 Tax=Scylla paramamosain TaxID=85552 RepID=UPI003082785E
MAHLSQILTVRGFYQFLKGICMWLNTFPYFDICLFRNYFLVCLGVHCVASAGLGWLAAAVFCKVLHDTWRSRNKAAGTPEADEREPARESVRRLKSSFDGETAEWLNKIIRQLWPGAGQYIYDLLKFSVEKLIQANLKKENIIKHVFCFEDISLGDTPFTLSDIKVLSQTAENNEIVMDMNFVYAGDCRIEINMNRKHLILDCLQIEGKVQVVMKPLMGRIPLIGGLQVFFLREPDVRFTLHPWEPVYKRNLCRQVKKMIADQMVAPNCWPIQLVEEITIEELKDISPAAQLMQQQSDGGGGRQRVIGEGNLVLPSAFPCTTQ